MSPLVAALGSMLVLAGLFGLVYYLLPSQEKAPKPPGRVDRLITDTRNRFDKQTGTRIVLGVALGAVAWILTGFAVLVLVLPAAFVWAPSLFSNKEEKRLTEKLSALQKWTAGLAGLVGTGTALETALGASLGNAPAPIRKEVGMLIARLNARWDTADALDAFGMDLGSQEADRVVLSLKLAARQRGPGLTQALNDLAEDVREIVQMTHEITASRTQPRGEARFVVSAAIIAVIIAPLLPMFATGYKTAIGQILYIVWVVLIALVIRVMQRTVTPAPASRLLFDDRQAAQ